MRPDRDVRYSDTSGWYSNYRIGETTAATKILIERFTDRIVGVHLLGPEYGELINFLGLAMKRELTAPTTQVHDRCLPHRRVRPRLDPLTGEQGHSPRPRAQL